MTYYPFEEMFPELGAEYGFAEVGNITLNAEKRKMTLYLRLPSPKSTGSIETLKSALKREYDLKDVEVLVRLPDSTFSQGIELAMKRSAEELPYAAPFLEGCEKTITGPALELRLKRGGADLLKSWAERVRALVRQWYEKDILINIVDMTDVDGMMKLIEDEKERSIREETKKVPAANGKGSKKTASALLGRRSKLNTIDMSDITLETGTAAVKGVIFSINHREIKKRNAYILSFDITDYTGSIRVSTFMEKERAEPIIEELSVGATVEVYGRISYNKFENDIVLEPESIIAAEPAFERMDDAAKKRVELHLHTRMSNMDAVVGAKEAVEQAARWGHRAVAITDHGVVQAFPEAMAASIDVNKGRPEGDKFKVLYGTECYFVNDIERIRSVYGNAKAPVDGEFVAFDIETTGLSASTERIIEIGAVRFRNGEIVESFNTFVDPERPIPRKITELTGISDEMVRGAPKISEAIEGFIRFSRGLVLAAHNATFDIGFMKEECRKLSVGFAPTFIDTRNMSRAMLSHISKFDLHTVANELDIPKFNHHRASDDAAAAAYILSNFLGRMKADGVTDIQEINSYLASKASASSGNLGSPSHMIILVRNQEGLRNLYELVSISHLNYFRRYPLIPRSELDRLREGLIIGSACESGELYKAIVAGRSRDELKRIASYYDYLEIQPLGNNEFLIREGKVKDRQALIDINRKIVELGEELGKPVVATCDVHFMEARDEVFRRILMAGKGFEDADNQAPLYFRTTGEMLSEFEYLGKDKAYEVVVENTNRIADMCDFVRPVKEGTYAPVIEGAADELARLVEENVLRLYGENPPPEVRERVDIEMDSIRKHHFDVIYMIAQKLVSKSLRDGYLVGSRGSVGSSVVAFFSGITEVNSLPPHYRCPKCRHAEFNHGSGAAAGPDLPDKTCPVCGAQYEKDGFDIPFATFLGFDGDKKPDIDLNFSGEYQAKAHKETEVLFGKGYVFRAGTIGTLAERTAYGFVKKYLDERGKVLSKAEENRLVKGIVGVKRTTGQHPGGLIIVPGSHNIYEFSPIQHPADDVKSDIVTTHFDYHSIEENLLKLDLLGHDDPTMIRMLYDLTGYDPQKIPLDDRDTMSLFTSTEALGFTDDPICGNSGTFAVPEFGTKFVREMLASTNPTTFDELIRISGLSHGTDVWLNNGQDIIKSGTATLKEIIAARDDIMLYLMSKGLDRKLSFTIMESVRKGKGLKPEWEAEMLKHDVPEWYLESCNKIKYMFPKAHAAAYVLMAFRIAWYKVHYPTEFYCAYFTIRAASFDAKIMTHGIEPVVSKLRELENLQNAKAAEKDMLTTLEVCYEFYRRGLTFEPIDLYGSEAARFAIGKNSLRPPFTAIPGIGETAAQDIVSARKKGEFLSVEELSMRCPKVSRAVIELLRENGVLDGLPDTSQVTLF